MQNQKSFRESRHTDRHTSKIIYCIEPIININKTLWLDSFQFQKVNSIHGLFGSLIYIQMISHCIRFLVSGHRGYDDILLNEGILML